MISPACVNHSSSLFVNVSQVCQNVGSFLKTTAYRVSVSAIYFLSPKQAVRPETFSEILSNVFIKFRGCLTLRCRKIQAIFQKQILTEEEIKAYLLTLSVFKTITENRLYVSTVKQEEALALIFNKALTQPDYLQKFDLFISSKKDGNLVSQHRLCKAVVCLSDSLFFERLRVKMERLSKIRERETLREDEKLNREDMAIFILLPLKASIAKILAHEGIGKDVSLAGRWKEIESISESLFFTKLKELCTASRPGGTIFVGDRITHEALNDRRVGCTAGLHEFFMGRLCHMGIYVTGKDTGLNLSHVNQMTRTHDITPIKSHLSTPFYYSLELDITALIPESVKNEHNRDILKKAFAKAFQEIASVKRPEHPLAQGKEQFKVLIVGHKQIRSQPLSKVDFPKKGTPLMCSSYVGIVFLKALHEVNVLLEKMNYKERIAHPFGEHENLLNLDILRLIYLWNQVNVIRVPAVDPLIARIFSPSVLELPPSRGTSLASKQIKSL